MSLTPKDQDVLDRLIAIEKAQEALKNGVKLIRPDPRFLNPPSA